MKPIVDPALEQYAAQHSLAPSALLNELAQYTREHCSDAQMLIGPLEGAVLRQLIALTAARRVLEIGLFTGYSALTMAEALPADGHVISCEINVASADIARGFFKRSPHGNKIEIRLGAALDTLRQLQGQQFDLVFIDADKENYPAYYELALPLLHRGGLLIADNVLWSGQVLAPEKASDHAIVAFNRRVAQDARVAASLITVRDGIMLARKLVD